MPFPRVNIPRSWIILIGVWFIFIILCRISVSHVERPVYSGDEKHLYEMSGQALHDVGFLAGHRPWLTPLMHKLASRDDQKLVHFQWWLFVLGFLVLSAAVFLRGSGGFSALPCAVFCLCFALTPNVLGWTMVVRAESSSLSMSVLFLAMLLITCFHLQEDKPRWNVRVMVSISLIVSGWLLSASRDNWAFILPVAAVMIWVPVFLIHLKTRTRRASLVQSTIVALVLFLVAGIQVMSSEKGDRWRPCLMNIIFQRILTTDHLQKGWVDRYGMPDDAVLDSLAGKWCFSNDLAGYQHSVFQSWLSEHGLASYKRDILTHPVRHADQVWRGYHAVINLDRIQGYQQGAADGIGPSRWLQGLIFFDLGNGTAELMMILIMIIPLAIGLLNRGRGVRAIAWGLFIMGAGMPLQMAVCYLGDSMALIRHCLPVTLTLRLLMLMNLGLVVMVITEFGKILRRSSSQSQSLP
jgi:hypothetical protein